MLDNSNIHSELASEIDVDRVESRLDNLWDIGKTNNGGVTRLAYSDAETEAFEYLLAELPDTYDVMTDRIGNVFAAHDLEGDRLLLAGSHLDSVYNGGRLDGTLGVVTALEAIEAAHAIDEELAIEPVLCLFRAEESARFGQHTIGSRGALGLLTVDDLAAVDDEGVPVWQAMQRAGYYPEELDEPVIDPDRIEAFLEVHIEQGRVLDEHDDDVGVATSIRAPVRHRAIVTGDYDHSGATPMDLRTDALTAASEMITTIEDHGTCLAADGDLVATVGDFTAVNGAINKVCGEVTFPIDVRSNDVSYRREAETTLLDAIREIAVQRDISLELTELDRSDPVTLDDDIVGVLSAITDSVEIPSQQLSSGGGHDAMNFQTNGIPAGLLFVPSTDGISHSPQEATETSAIESVTETLAHSLVEFPLK